MDLTLFRGETLGVIGESGCGKSVTALSVMQLLPSRRAEFRGEILFEGQDLLKKSREEMRAIRGNEIAMIFQEPMTSLNPVFTIGNQIMESIILHQKLGKKSARQKAIEMINLVGIPSPEKRMDEYPHHMSGGMRQRAMIAMALSCRPKLLIADEPTTALDVTIQAQILRLIRKIREETGMAVMMITHDLGVIAEVAEDVVVAYAGKAVEYADVKTIFRNPRHPYTRALYNSIPRLTDTGRTAPGGHLRIGAQSARFSAGVPVSSPLRLRPRLLPRGGAGAGAMPAGHRVRCFMYDGEEEVLWRLEQLKTHRKEPSGSNVQMHVQTEE